MTDWTYFSIYCEGEALQKEEACFSEQFLPMIGGTLGKDCQIYHNILCDSLDKLIRGEPRIKKTFTPFPKGIDCRDVEYMPHTNLVLEVGSSLVSTVREILVDKGYQMFTGRR